MASTHLVPMLGTVLGLAAGAAIGRWLSKRNALLRLRLKAIAALRSCVVLTNVRVPCSLLPPSRTPIATDREGLALCDVSITAGRISAVNATGSRSADSIASMVNAHGAVLMACWTDSHVHLVKTGAHPRARNPTGSISDALAVELDDQPRWAACPCCRPIAFANGGAATTSADGDAVTTPCPRADDVVRRMEFALASAFHHGTRAIRTHLDGTNSPDAKLRATVYAAFAACRERWASRGLHVQGVANLYLPLWRDAELAQRHVAEAVAHEGVLLGAYCGNVADTPEAETEAALDALLGYAQQHQLPVDLHIDESNDERCCCLRVLVRALRTARAAGYTQPVLLGHCTSLALQPPHVQRMILDGLRADGAVTVVCNPTTNLGLQDRRGSAAPHCSPIDAAVPRTPLWRGLTLIQVSARPPCAAHCVPLAPYATCGVPHVLLLHATSS